MLTIRKLFYSLNYNNVVIFDTMSPMVQLSSLNYYVKELKYLPHPKYLFLFFESRLRGANISYVPEHNGNSMNPSFKWIKTTAEYLNGNVHEFHKQEGGPDDADVQLARNVSYGSFSEFMTFFVTAPEICRILVPRGRPMNAVELMVMPFSWQVWTLLLLVLSLAEAVRHVWPELFKNDPILLVVCGFERYNLHEAGRWEKIVLHSLIILMFFMTNAFETKIISLMVNKPSVQTATKLEDFDKYGLKFRFNTSDHPQSVHHRVIGNYVVHGENVNIYDNEPGVAMYVHQELADAVPRLSHDFVQGQTWFVVLDEVYFEAIQVHRTAYRCQYLNIFKFTHVALHEAGVLDFWMRQYVDYYARRIVGIKPLGAVENGNFLVFDDMLLAWIILGIGYCLSFAGLLAELMVIKLLLKR